MHTTTATQITLSQIMPGLYTTGILADHECRSFTVTNQAPGLWSVAETDGETWLVTSLKKARALVAAEVREPAK